MRNFISRITGFCILVLLLVLVWGCKNDYKVSHYGALKKIMKENNLSSHVDFSTMESTAHLFALGALENLKGELIVLNGKPYQILVKQDSIHIEKNFNFKAAFAVTATVRKWKEYKIPSHIKSKKDFEAFLLKKATNVGIETDQPFPFLIEGLTTSVTWHVVNWPENDSEHTHEKHIKSGLYGTNIDEVVTFLGFYSDQHHGVFTHHTSNMHLHFLRSDEKLGGHVDDFVLGEEMVLKLPA